MQEPPDCLACGTCCFSTLPTYLRVSGDDHERLGEDAERLTHFVGNRCYMRIEEGRCAALVIEPEEGRFVCSVYERRPSLCRELERGTPACAGERDLKGDRPPILLARLRRARSRP